MIINSRGKVFVIVWQRRWTRFGVHRLPKSRSFRVDLGVITIGINCD